MKYKELLSKCFCVAMLGMLMFGFAVKSGGPHDGAESGNDYGISTLSDLPEVEFLLN